MERSPKREATEERTGKELREREREKPSAVGKEK